MAESLVELDGRTFEGGGQLVRNALCIAALTDTAIKIDNIRGNRSGGGGLKAQHLACVSWLARACNAYTEGAEKGSKALLFRPRSNEGGLPPAFKKNTVCGRHVYECRFDIDTAGSTGLALQAVLPYILFTKFPTQDPIRLSMSGGTNVSGSPSCDYVKYVLLPTLETIGLPSISMDVRRRGWSQGPSGIGSLILEIQPRASVELPSFAISAQSPGSITHVRAVFLGPASCHEEVKNYLRWRLEAGKHPWPDDEDDIELELEDSGHAKRLYLLLVATVHLPGAQLACDHYTLASDMLYQKKITKYDRAIKEMVDHTTVDLRSRWESGSQVDEHMRDQLIIFQALANGRSQIQDADNELSLHARTAEWVCKEMLGVRFDADGACEGYAFGENERTARLADRLASIQLQS